MQSSSDTDSDISVPNMEQDLLLLEIFSSEEERDESTPVFRVRPNYLAILNNSDFKIRFRLDKVVVVSLLEKIGPNLEFRSARNHGLSSLHQLLLVLRFYALGTMLISVGDFIGVSKSSACRIVWSVSKTIARLYPQYIKIEASRRNTASFYNIARFPRVLGVIDCTHVRIQSPGGANAEEFRNRKGYFSINVQAVCDANLRLMNVVARWPGSAHDATIFSNSTLRAQCESGEFGDNWLVGDSGYMQKKYMMVPLLTPRTPGELLYNEAHIRTRNCIERCFGVWKRRFPVISLLLRLSLERVNAVIVATAVLHNIAIDADSDIPTPEVDVDSSGQFDAPSHSGDDAVSTSERTQLIRTYFNSLATQAT